MRKMSQILFDQKEITKIIVKFCHYPEEGRSSELQIRVKIAY